VTESKSHGDDRIRAAEVIGSLCLATDLGMGFPFEHGLIATLTTMRLCDVLDVSSDVASQTFYACLLTHVGCTTDAETGSRIFHGSMTETGVHRMYGGPIEGAIGALAALPAPDAPLPTRIRQVVTGVPRMARFRKPHFTALCEVAEMLADRLGMPSSISGLFPYLTERWDGWSHLRRAKEDGVPLPIRIAHVGRDATYQRLIGVDEHVVDTIRSRAGHAFDPHIATVFVENSADVLGPMDLEDSVWDAVLDAEPRPCLELEREAIDRALGAVGAFADLASPYFSGHSIGVGNLAHAAAQLSGLGDEGATNVRRAGYLQDLGKVAVHPRIWEKEGSLSADEWEQVRLHPYHTERVLARSPFLSSVANAAFTHHERLDGSGYHRGINAASLGQENRLLAAADAFRSKIEQRPYRDALSVEQAASLLTMRADEGMLDSSMVAAVVEAAGLPPPPVEHPAGLTDREVEVLRLLAQGMQTKQVANRLDIAIKTADHHIQNTYRKIGVSTRAAATLFATEHGMVERPIGR
jgi:DNA-binding CsgD family transcriptional regulator